MEEDFPNPAEEPLEYVERSDGTLMRHKVNKVQKTLRVQQVANWLLDGMPSKRVVEKGMQKWGLSARSVERYIHWAKEQVEAMNATEIKGATTLALYRLTELYYAALESEDYKTALDVVKTQNRMLGLNAPDKIEARTVADWNSMTVAEQLEHVGTILARATDTEGSEDNRELN